MCAEYMWFCHTSTTQIAIKCILFPWKTKKERKTSTREREREGNAYQRIEISRNRMHCVHTPHQSSSTQYVFDRRKRFDLFIRFTVPEVIGWLTVSGINFWVFIYSYYSTVYFMSSFEYVRCLIILWPVDPLQLVCRLTVLWFRLQITLENH